MAFYTSVERIGNNLCIRAVSDTGKRKDIKLPYKPSLFEAGYAGSSSYTDLDGNPLKEIEFENMFEANQFIRNNSGKRLFGIKDFAAQFISEYYTGDIAWNIAQMRIILMDIETECHDGIATHDNPYGEILSVSAYDSRDQKIHFWHRKPFENKHDDVVCHFVKTEKELLKSFILFWINDGNYPDIVSHWNGSRYDIPYIVARIRKVFGDSAERVLKSLSPFGKYYPVEVKKKKTSKTDPGYEFCGITNFDYMDAYQKFNPREQESFTLDYICRLEIEDGKIPFDGSFTELYEQDPQTFFEYSIHDTRLLVGLDRKLRNIELACQIAFLTKAPQINMSLGTVNLWEIFIYNALFEKNILPELKGKSGVDRDNQYEGAFVKHPHIGKYDWIVSFDAASLYPSVARTFNVSIETYVEPDKELDALVPKNFGWEDMLEGKLDFSEKLRKRGLCISANRQFYRTDKEGILPELFGRCLEERSKMKGNMLRIRQEIEDLEKESKDKEQIRRLKDEADRLDVYQQSYKVLSNSLYGAVGNQYFQFYRVQNAEAITKGGHAIITITEATANKWLNEYCGTERKDRVIAIDTDSILCDFSDVVAKDCGGMSDEEITDHLDGIANELNKNIKAVFDDFVKRWNCPKNMISFKREKIARSGFWVAKKRYALHVIDNEGVRYAKPKTKITGLESVRSSTPPYYRKKIKEAIEKILSGTNKGIIEFIREQEEHMHDIPIEEISYPRGVSDMEKYIQPNGKLVESSVPIGVRAAYQFNKMCKRYDHKSEAPIKSGDKFRFCYLKMPNPSHENVIGFREKIPESFGLHDFIDVWEQFEKGFMSPLKKMLDAIGWTDGKITSIF